jgi:hypothetical protein
MGLKDLGPKDLDPKDLDPKDLGPKDLDPKDEAIDNAHFKRNLKTAAEQGDIHKVKEQLQEPHQNKQLNWADIKFSNPET